MYQFINFFAIFINLSTRHHRLQCKTTCCYKTSLPLNFVNMAHAAAANRDPHAPLHSYEVHSLNYLEKQCILGVMADSWMKNEALHSDMIIETSFAGRRLNLEPHEIELSANPNHTQQQAHIDNYSFGGAKMTTMLRNHPIVNNWANHLPRLTVVHLGACDLANGPQGKTENPTTAFHEFTDAFFTDLKRFARETIPGSRLEAFDAALAQHIFMLVGIPRWGDFDKVHPESLDAPTMKKMTKKANTGLNRYVRNLWEDHRVYLYTPNLEYPTYKIKNGKKDIHLDYNCQEVYNNKIFAVAKRLICSHCRIPTNRSYDDIKAAYQDIKENPNHCNRVHRA